MTEIARALRVLRRSPGFAAVAVLSLALGIGAHTAIYGVSRMLAAVLMVVAALAGSRPARRAACPDPLGALRVE